MTDARAVFNQTTQPDGTRPNIIHNGRQLDDIVTEAQTALHTANTPPTLFVRGGAVVRLRRSALYGINVAQGGTLHARTGSISGNRIGVNVSPSASLDLDEAFEDVEAVDNEIDVETTELPIPEPPNPGAVGVEDG